MLYTTIPPNTCPTEIAETAEACCMERMPCANAQHFKEHYVTCKSCASALEEFERFIRAMTLVAQMLKSGDAAAN